MHEFALKSLKTTHVTTLIAFSIPQVSTGKGSHDGYEFPDCSPEGQPVGWLVQPWKIMTGGGKRCWQQHVTGRWNPASSLRLNSKPSAHDFPHLIKQYGPSSESSLHGCNIGKRCTADPEVDQGLHAGLIRARRQFAIQSHLSSGSYEPLLLGGLGVLLTLFPFQSDNQTPF